MSEIGALALLADRDLRRCVVVIWKAIQFPVMDVGLKRRQSLENEHVAPICHTVNICSSAKRVSELVSNHTTDSLGCAMR